MKTIPHAITRTTAVRIAVARFELTPSIPTLARMDVRAANTEDNNANKSHISNPPKKSAADSRVRRRNSYRNYALAFFALGFLPILSSRVSHSGQVKHTDEYAPAIIPIIIGSEKEIIDVTP